MDIHALLKDEVGSYSTNEWTGMIGNSEVTLRAKPLSPADNARVLRKYPDFNTSMNFAGMVEYIVIKAIDADGKPVFREQHKPLLMRVSQDKIGEIFNALFGDQIDAEGDTEEGHEDRVKNS